MNSYPSTVNRNYFELFIRVFFRTVKRIFAISSASVYKLTNVFESIYPVSFNNDNQYFDSRHSLYEIDNFAEKSAIEIPPFASDIFAPILVPDLKSCFERMYSLFSSERNLYALTILIANAYALSYKLLFGSITKFSNCHLKCKTINKSSPYINDENYLLITANCNLKTDQICFC